MSGRAEVESHSDQDLTTKSPTAASPGTRSTVNHCDSVVVAGTDDVAVSCANTETAIAKNRVMAVPLLSKVVVMI